MIIRKYGLTLRRLQEDDLELVRQMRNSSAIRAVMQFRDEITPEMQQAWFARVNNFENYYYVVEYEGKKIALINDKNMDWEKRTSESGLFFWDKDYIHTFIPMLASMVLLDVGFYYLQWRTSYIHVMRDNPSAIDYTTRLGYTLCEGQQNEQNQLYCLTRDLFEQATIKIRKAARAFIDDESKDGYLLLEPRDYDSGLAQQIEKYFDDNQIRMDWEMTPAGKRFWRQTAK